MSRGQVRSHKHANILSASSIAVCVAIERVASKSEVVSASKEIFASEYPRARGVSLIAEKSLQHASQEKRGGGGEARARPLQLALEDVRLLPEFHADETRLRAR